MYIERERERRERERERERGRGAGSIANEGTILPIDIMKVQYAKAPLVVMMVAILNYER